MAEYDPWDWEDDTPDLDEEEGCDYGWGPCIDPHLRHFNCCFECKLYLEECEKQMEEYEPEPGRA